MVRVVCVDKGMLFPSMAFAGTYLGVWRQGISQTCRGIQPHTGGMVFRYATPADVESMEETTSFRVAAKEANDEPSA
jgi:hypothetical protein